MRRLLADVLLPFLALRALLIGVAWWARQYAPSWTYFDPVASARGWQWVPWRWLDVWGRYDTSWYLRIAERGYDASGAVGTAQGTAAFFPLYPLAIRAVHALLPAPVQGPQARYLVAVALANLFAVAALALLLQLARDVLGDDDAARRTVLLTLLWPAGFFLSAAYSESLFLLLSVGTLLAAQRSRWLLAGALAALAAVTRATGVLLVVPLAWTAVASGGFDLRRLRGAALPLLLPVAALAAHAAYVGWLTGEPLGLFRAQAAWHRHLAWPWETLLAGNQHRYVGAMDRAAAVLFALLTVALAVQRRGAWALWAAASLAPVLLSGVPMSATRLLAVAFPGFAALAVIGRTPGVHLAVCAALLAAQVALFTSWSRFYWSG